MIKIISGEHRSRHAGDIDQMHRLRYRIFHEEKSWSVPLINKWEIDGYDALNPLYVLSLDQNGALAGSFRLLPTTGFNMLNDTFPELLSAGLRIESPLIWECSRFAIEPCHADVGGQQKMAQTTAELGFAMNEIGMAAGLTHIVAVYDRAMHRMLKRFDCAGDPLGDAVMIGKVMTYAVIYEVGPEWGERIRRVSGLSKDIACDTGPVLRRMAAA